jgi:hypothetical protein
LIAGPDGATNTTMPDPDPGFGNVGRINGFSGVFVGNGWVLTAGHVGEAAIELEGVVYDPVPGSRVNYFATTGEKADLVAFKLRQAPPLPALELASGPPSIGETLTLVGNGRDRGAEISWGSGGWAWDTGRTLRWGTNRVSVVDEFVLDSHALGTSFDHLYGSRKNDPEAQVVPGDSGGAAFVWRGDVSELVGILYAQTVLVDQPASTSVFGNQTWIVDIDAYHGAIMDTITQPDCDDGLDEDADGLIDYPDDPGCASVADASEHSQALTCDNGIDDDGDGLVDYPQDPGCEDPFDPLELPEPASRLGLALGVGALAGMTRRRRG